MRKVLSAVVFTLLVSGCNMTQPAPYQADRKPEDRTEYSGAEGLAQQQKDQNYLMDKELSDKCFAAKVDLAVAESEGDDKALDAHKRTIADSCK